MKPLRKPDARTAKVGVTEESLHRDLDLAEIWAKIAPASEGEGLELASFELRAMRRERRGEGAMIQASRLSAESPSGRPAEFLAR